MADWQLLARDASGARSGELPVKDLKVVTRHFGPDTGIATVPYSRSFYQLLTEGAGIELLRNGQTISTGFITQLAESWGNDDGIKVGWTGEEILIADHLIIPDPTRLAEAQSTVTRWSRTGLRSQVMVAMLTEQLGPTAHEAYRIPGFTVGPDPLYGDSVSVALRYGKPNMLAELQSLATPAALGLRCTWSQSAMNVSVVAPREVADTAQFSVDLGNLVSYTFTRSAPTVTNVIVSGSPPEGSSGDPALLYRPQIVVSSTDPITTPWGRTIWGYLEESGTDTDALTRAGVDELAKGAAGQELACVLRDTERLAFGDGWRLGDRATVHVGRPGEPKTPVIDVVREVAFELGPKGEQITPAIGSSDATALPTLPSRQMLNNITARLAGLERGK